MTHLNPGASKEALFCIGSNCGDRGRNIADALRWMDGFLANCHHSSIYATPDCHGGQTQYFNAVVTGLTPLHPLELESLCKEFEISLGRDADARAAGEVPVDIDVVVYDGEVLRMKDFSSEFFQIGFRQLTFPASPSSAED